MQKTKLQLEGLRDFYIQRAKDKYNYFRRETKNSDIPISWYRMAWAEKEVGKECKNFANQLQQIINNL